MKRTRRNSSSQGRFDLGVIFPLDTHNPARSFIASPSSSYIRKPSLQPFSFPILSCLHPRLLNHPSLVQPHPFTPPRTFSNRIFLLWKVLFPPTSSNFPSLSWSFFIPFDISFIASLFTFPSLPSSQIRSCVVTRFFNQTFNLPASSSLSRKI